MNPVTLDYETKQHLRILSLAAKDTLARRAKLILAYADGMQTFQAAQEAGISRSRARFWKRMFLQKGMFIFEGSANRSEGLPNDQPSAEDVSPLLALGEADITGDAFDSNTIEKADKRKRTKRSKLEIPALPLPETVKTPGVLLDDSLAEAGRKVFLAQFAEMLSHEEGTRSGEDIESLHDMRVATRRMRAAFSVFGDAYLKKVIKPYLNGLRKTGRLLGSVRDLDVFMVRANSYLEMLPIDARGGLNPLLVAWNNQLNQARGKLIQHLNSESYQEFKLCFNYFVQSQGYGVKDTAADIPAPRRVREVAPCLIYTRLGTVRAFGDMVHTAAIPQLHALRIEFKKLRYTLEFFLEVLGNEVKPVVGMIKKLQDHLGDLHDADVACQVLNEFIEKWDMGEIGLQLSERQNPEPIVDYLAFQYAERHRLMVTFPETWAQFEQQDIMRKIAAAISVL